MTSMRSIDLNCDMGELPEAIGNGSQEAIMPFLTSVNVACGGHAGDDATMSATIEQAKRWKLSIGAHPSYPDRANFGRLGMEMSSEGIAQTVFEQVRRLGEAAAEQGVTLRHVKPHGALYNAAAGDARIAGAFAEGVARWSRNVVLVGLAGSNMLQLFRGAGFAVASEAFADRRYEADGSLRARRFPDALITDPALAARQAVEVVEEGSITAVDGSRVAVGATTICIHGDTSGARAIAAVVARTLRGRGIELRGL
jgi:UPF0271 protein